MSKKGDYISNDLTFSKELCWVSVH